MSKTQLFIGGQSIPVDIKALSEKSPLISRLSCGQKEGNKISIPDIQPSPEIFKFIEIIQKNSVEITKSSCFESLFFAEQLEIQAEIVRISKFIENSCTTDEVYFAFIKNTSSSALLSIASLYIPLYLKKDSFATLPMPVILQLFSKSIRNPAISGQICEFAMKCAQLYGADALPLLNYVDFSKLDACTIDSIKEVLSSFRCQFLFPSLKAQEEYNEEPIVSATPQSRMIVSASAKNSEIASLRETIASMKKNLELSSGPSDIEEEIKRSNAKIEEQKKRIAEVEEQSKKVVVPGLSLELASMKKKVEALHIIDLDSIKKQKESLKTELERCDSDVKSAKANIDEARAKAAAQAEARAKGESEIGELQSAMDQAKKELQEVTNEPRSDKEGASQEQIDASNEKIKALQGEVKKQRRILSNYLSMLKALYETSVEENE